MYRWRSTLAVMLCTVGLVLSCAGLTLAEGEDPPDSSYLSPYWEPDVARWEPIIVQHAEARNLDPDLIAAVIWKESWGRAGERGPVGAVGLMGLMPFEWRPSEEELENPWTNLFWGARALAHTIRDGNGDLYYSLAAYNGGWERVHLGVTRRYAEDVLNHYASAIAVRNDLPADGGWIAIFATEGAASPRTITVVGPHRPLARYTERPWAESELPTIPANASPLSTTITFEDEQGRACRVHVWMVTEGGLPITPRTSQVASPSHHLAAEAMQDTQQSDTSLRWLNRSP